LLTVFGASCANSSQTISPREVLIVAVYFLFLSMAMAGGFGYCLDIRPPVYQWPAGAWPASSQNFSRSRLPPETMATTFPAPPRPASAAATAQADAPSQITLFRSATKRIAASFGERHHQRSVQQPLRTF